MEAIYRLLKASAFEISRMPELLLKASHLYKMHHSELMLKIDPWELYYPIQLRRPKGPHLNTSYIWLCNIPQKDLLSMSGRTC